MAGSVLWWVREGARPVWADGAERLEHLADYGPTPRAFTFKKPFCPDGEPVIIDRDRVKAIGSRNAVGQRELLAGVRLLEP